MEWVSQVNTIVSPYISEPSTEVLVLPLGPYPVQECMVHEEDGISWTGDSIDHLL
jgi:hypothetical protein